MVQKTPNCREMPVVKTLAVGEHLVLDPCVCSGKLIFKGSRVPVQTVLTYLVQGDTIEEILEGWPELKREAVEEAIFLASRSWPELLRKPADKKLQQAASELELGPEEKADSRHEPAHSGQSA